MGHVEVAEGREASAVAEVLIQVLHLGNGRGLPGRPLHPVPHAPADLVHPEQDGVLRI